MAFNRGATMTKRERERARQQKRVEKAAKKDQRRKEKVDKPDAGVEADPDIAGIVPGPQPIQE
jgi:hypothetical protein